MKSFWENDAILWREGIKQRDLVMKDKDGNKTHTRPDPEKFFPTRVRITMIQVSAGSTYDPNLVPEIPPRKLAGKPEQERVDRSRDTPPGMWARSLSSNR